MSEPAPSPELWSRFCRQLEEAGRLVLEPGFSETELDRAEGYRYLTRLLRIALDMNLEHADPDFPTLYRASHETAKIGGDNPDNYYQNATISGDRRYRIWGRRGTVPILTFGSKANRYAIDGTMASTGELDVKDMYIEPDGSFEIIASQDRAAGNWLPLAPDSSFIVIRQTFFGPDKSGRADIHIEALDAPAHPAPLSAARLEDGLMRAAAFTAGTARTFQEWAKVFRAESTNKMVSADQEKYFRAGGDPSIFYIYGWVDLAPGQALRIDADIPECEGWNFQFNNVWMESLDYRFHRIHVNNHTARLNPDGSATIVVGPRDPGFGNWIDTAGHTKGIAMLRWTGAQSHPLPRTEVIDLDD